MPELREVVGAGFRIAGGASRVPGLDGPVELLDLILARLDREAGDVMRLGERAQLGERDGLIGARRQGRVDADGEIPEARLLGLRRNERRAGREDAVARLEGGGELRLQRRLPPAVGEGERCALAAIGHALMLLKRKRAKGARKKDNA